MRDLPPVRPFAIPLIIGHRGSSAVAPENTIASFTRAVRDGADGFEFDVRLAGDGVPVVIHDATLQRTGPVSGAISAFTSRELARFDVGSWFNHQHPDFARPDYAKETVPTLEQVLDLTTTTKAVLYLEMKSNEVEVGALAKAVVELLRKYSFANRVIVESFNLAALKEVKRLNADIRTAALFEPRLKRPLSLIRKTNTVELAVRAGADEIALHHSLATRRVTGKASAASLPVVVWTVDTPVWLKRALARGIHALITNDPAPMLGERLRLFGV